MSQYTIDKMKSKKNENNTIMGVTIYNIIPN